LGVGAYGSHLALLASEDIPGNDHGGSANFIKPVDLDHMPDKSDMRRSFRIMRDDFDAQLTSQDRELAFSVPPTPLRSLFTTGKTVAAYIPTGSEADPSALLKFAADAGCQTALPYIASKAAPMQFLSWSLGQTLETGLFGLQQPQNTNEVLVPDIVLTPLVAFDRHLARIGQGAGHYDRALCLLDAVIAVGVAWSIQEAEMIAADPWDIPLDAVLTEKEWISA
jgi:5-formyltetrahydrofolate cyclo-ligase